MSSNKTEDEKSIDEKLLEFNHNLIEKQQELDPELSKILHDNLWDLLT